MISVTFDGDTHWLECFADDPGSEHGHVIRPLGAGDDWMSVIADVAQHQVAHGCA